MSTLLVANEHASWMKLKSKRYSVFLSLIVVWYLYTVLSCELFITPKYKTSIKFFCMNNVRLKTTELLDTYIEKGS